jgi:hypothetical protein
VRGTAAVSDTVLSDTPVPDGSADDPSYTVSGLRALTLYQFRVRANNRLGSGPWSPPTERVRTSAVSSDHAAFAAVKSFV